MSPGVDSAESRNFEFRTRRWRGQIFLAENSV